MLITLALMKTVYKIFLELPIRAKIYTKCRLFLREHCKNKLIGLDYVTDVHRTCCVALT